LFLARQSRESAVWRPTPLLETTPSRPRHWPRLSSSNVWGPMMRGRAVP